MKHDHSHHQNMDGLLPEVNVTASYGANRLTLAVQDTSGNAVELADTHEKRMHLIVVSSDLETFIHAHPEKNSSGDFEVDLNLPTGDYLAFADINPIDKTYTITPMKIQVGKPVKEPKASLRSLADKQNNAQTIDGKTVSFNHDQPVAGKPVMLNFDLHGESPLTYLGALGHVVVIDEKGEQFIHVHPSSEDQPVFEAHFPFAGLYKLWVEFKFSDKGVIAFPFIVEVQE